MHLGVKVTLLREGTVNRPAIRMFDTATDWIFADEHPGGTLHIVKQVNADATANPDDIKRITIAEFPASGIESVEFASKETT